MDIGYGCTAGVTGAITDLRVDAVISAVLHRPGANSVVADKNRAEIDPVQGDEVYIGANHIGEVIGFDPEKGLLSIAVFGLNWRMYRSLVNYCATRRHG